MTITSQFHMPYPPIVLCPTYYPGFCIENFTSYSSELAFHLDLNNCPQTILSVPFLLDDLP